MQMLQVPREQYEEMKAKAEAFDLLVDTEGLTTQEIRRLTKARQTRLLTRKEFLGKHQDLEN